MKSSKKSLSDSWKEIVISDLKNSKKLKADLQDVDPIEFIPDSSTGSLVKVATMLIRAKGVVKTARAADIPRSSLYSVMSEDSNPTLNTFNSILGSAGYQLAIIPIEDRR